MSYVDIAILALIACFALFGFIKGFFKSIVSFFSFVISAVVAVLLASMVAQMLLGVGSLGDLVIGPDGSLFALIKGWLPDDLAKVTVEEMAYAYHGGGANAVKALFDDQGLIGSFFIKLCYSVVEKGAISTTYLQSSVYNAQELFALELSFGIFSFIVGIGIFIVLRILTFLFSLILKKGVLKGRTKKSGIGRIFGLVIGAAKGLTYALLILTVLSLMSNFNFMKPINEQLEESRFSKPLVTLSTTITSTIINFRPSDERYSTILELAGFDQDVRDLNNLPDHSIPA